MSKSNFCIAPWMTTHVWPDGRVYPCCTFLTRHQGEMGNINDKPLEEIWNDESYKELRKQFLNNEQPKGCSRCYEQEELDPSTSYRHYLNTSYNTDISTNPDGSTDSFKLKMWDFRLSNYCNFKCRSCTPFLSSAWFKDGKDMGRNDRFDKALINVSDKVSFTDMLKDHYDCVEEIYFAGGEPLIMDDHYNILNELIKRGRTDVMIRYSSNLSRLTFKDQSILDLWENFSNIRLWASADGIGKIGEYVRSGFNSKKWTSNMHQIINSPVNFNLNIVTITYGVENLLHISDFIVYLIENGVVRKTEDELHKFDVDLSPIYDPPQRDASILPDRYKKIFKEHLDGIRGRLESIGCSQGMQNRVSYIMNIAYGSIMRKSFDKKLIDTYIKETVVLDKLRKENFQDTFPYFESLESLAHE